MRKHLERFVELAPDVARNIRAEHLKCYSEEFVELRLEGLRKAGLDVAGGVKASSPDERRSIDRSQQPSPRR